jgi:hypothetical protein
MVLGHLTVTAAGHRLLKRRFPELPVQLGLLLVGAYLPDLVDKPANMFFGLPGRSYGHSLVVQLTIFAASALLVPASRRVLAPLALGAAIHLLEDWPNQVVLLAPLLGPIPPAPRWSFWESLVRYYSSGGPQVWLEIAAVAYWVGVALRRRKSPGEVA